MQENKEKNIKVTDIETRIFIVGDKIGQGGQGAVFRVKDDSDIAIKLNLDADGNPLTDNDAINTIFEKLKTIRRLPIPQNINLSKPLSILKTHAGYVMSFMNGMKSFDSFLNLNEKIQEKDIPSWLKTDDGNPVPDAEIWINYCNTGSLRERLLSLYKISELLATLHANGLVYGDISCGNLMYKKTSNSIIAGLIDADNINFQGKSKTYYTPGFGAPEVVNKTSPATIYSDAYSFAVVAFYVLTMLHPFKGKKVLGLDEDEGWSKSVSKQANQDYGTFNDDGSFPWIFDLQDDSNSFGNLEQVNSLFLNPLLFALFDNTFSAGHTNPKERTPLLRWASAFSKSADQTIKCPACEMTYYYDYKENDKYCCPYCETERGNMILMKTYSNNDELIHTYSHEIDNQDFYIPSRCFEPFKINQGDEPLIKVIYKEDCLELHLIDDKIIYIVENDKKERFVGIYKIDITKDKKISICLINSTNIERKIIITGEVR